MKTFVWVLTTFDSTGNLSSEAYGSLREAADMLRSIYAPDGSLDSVPDTLLADRIEQTDLQFTLERQQIELPNQIQSPGMHRWMRAADVLSALNRAEDDIITEAKLDEDGGTAAALNLMVNAVYDYLFNPYAETLEQVVELNYEDCDLEEIVERIA